MLPFSIVKDPSNLPQSSSPLLNVKHLWCAAESRVQLLPWSLRAQCGFPHSLSSLSPCRQHISHLRAVPPTSTVPNTQAFNILGRRHPFSMRKNLSTKKVVKYWNRMAGEVVEPPCLEAFRKHVNVARRDMV